MLAEIEEQIIEIEPTLGAIMYESEQSGPVTAEDYQIRLWVDRYRGAELLFQPSIVGLDCCGFADSMQNIFTRLSVEERKKLLANVSVQGGNSLVPGFVERIQAELQRFAIDQKVKVTAAKENRQL